MKIKLTKNLTQRSFQIQLKVLVCLVSFWDEETRVSLDSDPNPIAADSPMIGKAMPIVLEMQNTAKNVTIKPTVISSLASSLP